MRITPRIARPLGTMIAYGFARIDVADDLDLAVRIGARCVEAFPHWRELPDPAVLRRLVDDRGLIIHSAHGSWGGQSIAARRVDLGSLDPDTRRASLDDLSRCAEWLAEAGGRHLVVHPGGLSEVDEFDRRRAALIASLALLADSVRDLGVVICVENMPPGVNPGSRMADLAAIVAELDRPEVALALDTGHARLVGSPEDETSAAGSRLRTTHVHDNNGRQDIHLPPGIGVIDWAAWIDALDRIDYRGPVMLECIRQLREHPEILTDDYVAKLGELAGLG